MGKWKQGGGAGAHLLPRFQQLGGIEHKVAGGEESNVCRYESAKMNLVHSNREAVSMSNLV